MKDEEKPAGKAEDAKQSASQPAAQQNPPASTDAAPAPAVEYEGNTADTAITHKVNRSTEKLKVGELTGMPDGLPLAFGGEPGSAKWFRRLPVSMSTSELPPETPRWRVELVGLSPTVEPMGLEVVGDTVIGRGRVGTEPADLDLDMYGALEKGVSRRHGLFRPTTNHLYIIDLGSTNGTLHNGIPLGPGVARALKHNDTITLGRFSFTIKIVDGPTIRKAAEPEPLAIPTTAEDAEQTKPMQVMDVAEVRAKKAKLAPPSFDSPTPETAKLQSEQAAKTEPQLSALEASMASPAARPPVAIPESPVQQVGAIRVENKPPVPESAAPPAGPKPSQEAAQPPVADARPAGGEEKAEEKPQAEKEKSPAVEAKPPADDTPPKRASLLGE